MNNVVVMFTDDKEVLFENAYFTVESSYKCVLIYDQNDTLIAVFNFDNIAGVKLI